MREFLTPFIRDLLTVVGGIGFVLTVVGVWLAWWQLRKTVSSSEAALLQLSQSKQKYAEYLYTYGLRLLAEARSFASSERFEQALLRLVDLGDVILKLSIEDNSWDELRNSIAEMETTFERIAKGELKFRTSLKSKWRDLEQKTRVKFQEKTGPFGSVDDDI